MDFRTEFFPLLNKALYKTKCSIPTLLVNNSDMYMFNRYVSFYHPNVVEIINSTTNKRCKLPQLNDFNGEYYYQVLDSILPKLNHKRISYVSKKKSTLVNKADNFVKAYSKRHNLSEKKVWEMLYLVDNINNNMV